jgi:hypothetical protein
LLFIGGHEVNPSFAGDGGRVERWRGSSLGKTVLSS